MLHARSSNLTQRLVNLTTLIRTVQVRKRQESKIYSVWVMLQDDLQSRDPTEEEVIQDDSGDGDYGYKGGVI